MVEIKLDIDEPRLIVEKGPAAKIANIVGPILKDLDMRLVRVTLSSQEGGTLQIMAERADGSMGVDDCEAASMAIAPVLDLEDPISNAYRLEVSSPGIDRPLVRYSDFVRATGKAMRIETSLLHAGRRRFKGMLTGIAEREIIFLRDDALPHEGALVHIPLASIVQARLILTEELIRESLRVAKSLERDEHAEGKLASVRKGPGRFAKKKEKPHSEPLGVESAHHHRIEREVIDVTKAP